MRAKTYYSARPEAVEIKTVNSDAVILFRENIEEDGEQFSCDEYKIITKNTRNLAERVNAEWLARAKEEDYDMAAAAVRAERDKLLAESDAAMALDRLGLSVPSGTTFTAWLSFLKGLGEVLSGKMATYRQALRDIPEQAGFPYDVEWPTK